MAKGHWLDPLARRLLQAAGYLPRHPLAATAPGGDGHDEAVELELLSLKLHQNPWLPLADEASVQRAAQLGVRLDVNRATAAQWQRLPGMHWRWIDQLLHLQRHGSHLHDLAELGQRLGVSSTLLKRWQPVLVFHAPASPPRLPPLVDVNGATGQQLAGLPGLTGGHVTLLLRERQRRRFRSLTDLQQRLQLADPAMAALAGRLHCGRGPVPPDLPKRGLKPNRSTPLFSAET